MDIWHKSTTRGIGRKRRWRWLFVSTWLALGGLAPAATLQDLFANRQTTNAFNGEISANNTNATFEAGEPKHGGKTGGHSMWLSWIAPSNCIVKFKTEASQFDTLLAAYRFNSTNDTTLDKLQLVVGTDDSEGFERESEIEFGAVAGQRYEIAVDGYYGAQGNIDLQWDTQVINVAPPVLLGTPGDLAAKIGDPVSLTVLLTNRGSATLKWFFNGDEEGPGLCCGGSGCPNLHGCPRRHPCAVQCVR